MGFGNWTCGTCPYEFQIMKEITSRTRPQCQQVDHVFGREVMWKHAVSIAGKNPIFLSLLGMVHDLRLDLFRSHDPSFTPSLLAGS